MNKKLKIGLVAIGVLIAIIFIVIKFKPKADTGNMIKEISPVRGSIQAIISTTGTVLPKNRLEIKPPVGGRIESILVKEGQKVKTGEILAWMSSTERAALLDAARGQGEEKLKYWQEAYKPIALLASIDAEVIVATTQPGQTVTTADAVVVLSDKLIARAQVDETDIGKIRLGQKAIIILDAYPEKKISGQITKTAVAATKTATGGSVIPVELSLATDLKVKHGFNGEVTFTVVSKKDVLVISRSALHKENGTDYVYLVKNNKLIKTTVKTGESLGSKIEIITGLMEDDEAALGTVKR